MYAVIGCGKCGCSLLGTLLQIQKKSPGLYQPIAVSSTVDDLVRSGTQPDNWLGITHTGELVSGREKGFGQKITGGLGKDFVKGFSIFSRSKRNLLAQLEAMLPGLEAKEEREEINFALLFAGLGGGTGGGGAPVVGEVFKEKGIPVIAVAVLPADSEGNAWAWNAFRSLQKLLNSVDGLLLADNNVIDRPKGLSAVYPQFNRYVVGCIADFIFGSLAAGPGVKHGGMASFDYRDFITSLSVGEHRGVGVLGRSTMAMGYLGGLRSIEPETVVRAAISQLTVGDVPIGHETKKIACIGTIHGSLRRNFPYHELEDYLKSITHTQQAYVGFNQTKKRMARLTLSLTYAPEDIPRLWRLKDRAKAFKEIDVEKPEPIGGERLFDEVL